MYKILGAFSVSPLTYLPHVLSLFLVLTQVTCTQERGQEKKKSTLFLGRGYSRSIYMVYPTSRALILRFREPVWEHLHLLILSVSTMALDPGK